MDESYRPGRQTLDAERMELRTGGDTGMVGHHKVGRKRATQDNSPTGTSMARMCEMEGNSAQQEDNGGSRRKKRRKGQKATRGDGHEIRREESANQRTTIYTAPEHSYEVPGE